MKTLILATAFTALSLTGAQAQSVAALSGDNTISIIDAAAKKVTRTMKISGASGSILGIDVRPADGKLYALASDGTVYTVDTTTGAATMKSKLETTLKAGVKATVDFNPVADRLRVIGSDGTNLRANVDDGKVITDGTLKYAETDANKGKAPMVTAGAYSNSFAGTKETALYDIDTATGTFTKQAPPNDGVLMTISTLPLKDGAAFDIVADGKGGNMGWIISGDEMHSVDIGTGMTKPFGKIAGLPAGVRDIAVVGAN